MKTIIFSVLFSGVFGADACAGDDVKGTAIVTDDCKCGTTDPCAKADSMACLVGANDAAVCDTVDNLGKLAACTDGKAATATCACNSADDITAAVLTTYHICVKDETCTIAPTGDAKRCAAAAADDADNSGDATMIGSFAAVMTTTMLSF